MDSLKDQIMKLTTDEFLLLESLCSGLRRIDNSTQIKSLLLSRMMFIVLFSHRESCILRGRKCQSGIMAKLLKGKVLKLLNGLFQ